MPIVFILLSSIPYPSNPSWESASGYYSTGGGHADLNGDGITDLAVGEGNDMQAAPNHVYYGNGTSFSVNPSWSSTDSRYSGHIAIGDVNGDGHPDLAVSDYIKPGWGKTVSVLYMNTGSGLGTTPVWTTDSMHSFACAFGDVNGDGRPELAFACGEAYNGFAEKAVIYLNNGTGYSSPPWWQSADGLYAYDVTFGDVNRDGWLDMVLAGNYMPVCLFLNKRGYYATTPDWESADDYEAIQCSLGDINRDGYLDLAIAENGQLGGRSRVWVFMNQGGIFENSPSWNSQDSRNYYSTVAFGDPDADGDLDLAAGGWWEPAVIFENIGGTLQKPPGWSWYRSGLVNEKITFGGVDNGGLVTLTDTFTISGRINVVQLPRMPFHELVSLNINGANVPASDLYAAPEEGFVCFDTSYTSTGVNTIILTYTYSVSQDMTITNWENTMGNYLFLNAGPAVTEMPDARPGIRIFPNPFISEATLYRIGGEAELYDASGRLIGKVNEGRFGADLQPGVYFIGSGPQRVKAVKLR
ncbi:MAG: T9SS type A sorting domain-containing protein [candidate division WOR-3 bacterium]